MNKSEPMEAGSSEPARTHSGSARLCAARAVQHVLRDQEQLETALSRQTDYGALSVRDRAFARLISATVFRRMGQIDAALKPFLKRKPAPFPHAVLRTGAAQLLFLKTPVHAAVGESVGLLKTSSKTRAYAGMVNAVLRKVADKGPGHVAATPPSANIPGWIRTSWEKAYGKPAMRRMAMELLKEPPLDIHVRSDSGAWAEALETDVIADWAVRRKQIGSVQALAGFNDQAWWVQDIAASLPVRSLGDIVGKTVLDMCAAPGGKTLQLAAAGADVTALDKSPDRMGRVEDNLTRLGLSATMITADATEWAREVDDQYDVILLDAPCSATGTYRRHPDVLYNREPKDVASLVRLQKRLIKAAASRLKPGGHLLYCTCSLQPEEGEGQVDYILSNYPDFKVIACPELALKDVNVLPDEKGYFRILPHLLAEKGGNDGFFSVLMQKNVK